MVEDGRVVANKEKKVKQTERNECMSESDKQKIKDTEKNTSDSEEIFNPTTVTGTPKMIKSDASAKLEASKCKGDNENDKPVKSEVNSDPGTIDANTDVYSSVTIKVY